MSENNIIPSHEKDFSHYLTAVARRWKICLLVLIVVFLGTAAYTLSLVSIYQAGATIFIGRDKGGKVGPQGAMSYNAYQESLAAEIETLKSRSIAEKAAKQLHLDWQVSKRSTGLGFTIQEFSAAAQNVPYRIELTGPDTFTVKDPSGNLVGSGRAGVLMQVKGVALLLRDLRGKTGDSFILTLRPLDMMTAKVLGGVSAYEIGTRTNLVRLTYSDSDPERARDVVNAMARIYLDYSIELKNEETSKSIEYVEKQMSNVQADLDKAQKNLQDYKKATGIFSLDSVTLKAVNKIADADKEKLKVVMQRKGLESAIASLKAALKSGTPYFPHETAGSVLAARLMDLETQKKSLQEDYTDDHPQVRSLKRQIDTTKRNLLTLYENAMKDLVVQEASYDQLIAEYQGDLKGLSEEELELVNLSRPVKVSTDIFTFLLQKHQEARVAKASTVSDSRIIDTAITPQRPIKPDKRKNIIMGLLVGLFLGVGSALLLDMLDNTIKDAQEAKEQLGLPILSVIPFIPSHGEGKASLVTHLDPKSAVSEVFRSLRTNIHFSAVNKRKQFLMVTSAFPGEGKTTIIGNLAVVLGQSRSRVLLMDCDLRRPSLHTLFGKSKAPGLTELLAGDTDFDKVVYDTGIPGVDFISAGTTPPNPAELLGSEVMKGLLNSLAERYDIILLDAPPVLAVTDAPLLSLMSDMVLVVIEARRVPLKAAHHMLEMLENVGAPLAGIVLNNKDVRSVTRYGYYGASYYGHSYYGEERQVPDKAWWRRWLKI